MESFPVGIKIIYNKHCLRNHMTSLNVLCLYTQIIAITVNVTVS